jgi:hypothetical protein
MATRKQYRAPSAFAVEIQKRNKKEKRAQLKHYVAGVLTPRDLEKLGKERLAKLVEEGRILEETIREPDEVIEATDTTKGSRKKAASETAS